MWSPIKSIGWTKREWRPASDRSSVVVQAMLTRGLPRSSSYEGKLCVDRCYPGRGGGSKRWLNTGCHLLTAALSSSHWFPVKCIAETRRSAPKRHKHELIFEVNRGWSPSVTLSTRAGSRTCVVSVVSWCVSAKKNRRDGRSRINERSGWRRRQWRKAHEAKSRGDPLVFLVQDRSDLKSILDLYSLDMPLVRWKSWESTLGSGQRMIGQWIGGILFERTIMIMLSDPCNYLRERRSLVEWLNSRFVRFDPNPEVLFRVIVLFFLSFFPPPSLPPPPYRPAHLKNTVETETEEREDNSFRECVRWRKPIEGWTIGTRRNVKERETRVSNCFAALHDVVLNDEAGC